MRYSDVTGSVVRNHMCFGSAYVTSITSEKSVEIQSRKMAITPVENLRGFVSSRPPLVVFMLCLGLFAIVLLTVANYIQVTELRNPDVSEDWNSFLTSFAQLDFCIVSNVTEVAVSPPATMTSAAYSTRKLKVTPPSIATTTQNGTYPNMAGTSNFSVSMLLTIKPTKEFLGDGYNLTYLSGAIYGNDLGLSGAAADELINVTINVPIEWNMTRCSNLGFCDSVKIFTCVHFQAPSFVFPDSMSPDRCENVNDTMSNVDYSARIVAQQRRSHYTTYYCRARPFIRVHYKLDPTLTVWLTLRDRSMINLHLLHTSYFLFVMMITLFCYATFRGRYHKTVQQEVELVNHA
ncbi:Transmembrane protein 219 [Lamellibrachia satsuma]|nr:Transmembrane protein 219 [Lamellibrachia satsuma]